MFKEKLEAKISGFVEIFLKYEDGSKESLYKDHNAIQAWADDLLAEMLGNGYVMDGIVALKSSSELATATITTTIVSTNSITYTATFSATSFNNTLDELRLKTSYVVSNNYLSALTGLNITKNNSQQLEVNWTITIAA